MICLTNGPQDRPSGRAPPCIWARWATTRIFSLACRVGFLSGKKGPKPDWENVDYHTPSCASGRLRGGQISANGGGRARSSKSPVQCAARQTFGKVARPVQEYSYIALKETCETGRRPGPSSFSFSPSLALEVDARVAPWRRL